MTSTKLVDTHWSGAPTCSTHNPCLSPTDLLKKPKLGLKPKMKKTSAEDEEMGEGNGCNERDESDNSDDDDQRL